VALTEGDTLAGHRHGVAERRTCEVRADPLDEPRTVLSVAHERADRRLEFRLARIWRVTMNGDGHEVNQERLELRDAGAPDLARATPKDVSLARFDLKVGGTAKWTGAPKVLAKPVLHGNTRPLNRSRQRRRRRSWKCHRISFFIYARLSRAEVVPAGRSATASCSFCARISASVLSRLRTLTVVRVKSCVVPKIVSNESLGEQGRQLTHQSSR
jgi:hypothetical protein